MAGIKFQAHHAPNVAWIGLLLLSSTGKPNLSDNLKSVPPLGRRANGQKGRVGERLKVDWNVRKIRK